MYYQEFLPSKPLQPYIQLFGIIETQSASAELIQEITPPHLAKGLVFHYFEDSNISVSKKSYQGKLPSAYFMLDNQERLVVSHQKKIGSAAIIFKPGKFRYFFPFDTAPHIDHYLSLTDYNEPMLVELHEKLQLATSAVQRVQLLDDFCLKMLAKITLPKSSYSELLIQNMFADTHWKLHQSAAELQLSERHLRRVFKREIGVSPKDYHKVLRFSKAMARINTKQFTTLTQLSYSLGYSEQKHFILDFKEFMGLTPSQYKHSISPLTAATTWREEVEHQMKQSYDYDVLK
ncbi:MAG: helix-turn-helix domain-containing protein [Bacteroidota bacterium]